MKETYGQGSKRMSHTPGTYIHLWPVIVGCWPLCPVLLRMTGNDVRFTMLLCNFSWSLGQILLLSQLSVFVCRFTADSGPAGVFVYAKLKKDQIYHFIRVVTFIGFIHYKGYRSPYLNQQLFIQQSLYCGDVLWDAFCMCIVWLSPLYAGISVWAVYAFNGKIWKPHMYISGKCSPHESSKALTVTLGV